MQARGELVAGVSLYWPECNFPGIVRTSMISPGPASCDPTLRRVIAEILISSLAPQLVVNMKKNTQTWVPFQPHRHTHTHLSKSTWSRMWQDDWLSLPRLCWHPPPAFHPHLYLSGSLESISLIGLSERCCQFVLATLSVGKTCEILIRLMIYKHCDQTYTVAKKGFCLYLICTSVVFTLKSPVLCLWWQFCTLI